MSFSLSPLNSVTHSHSGKFFKIEGVDLQAHKGSQKGQREYSFMLFLVFSIGKIEEAVMMVTYTVTITAQRGSLGEIDNQEVMPPEESARKWRVAKCVQHFCGKTEERTRGKRQIKTLEGRFGEDDEKEKASSICKTFVKHRS